MVLSATLGQKFLHARNPIGSPNSICLPRTHQRLIVRTFISVLQ